MLSAFRLVLLVSLICVLARADKFLETQPAPSETARTKFALMIDAGSSGSRLHVFRYTVKDSTCNVHGFPLVQMPSEQKKKRPGLSTLAGQDFDVPSYFQELFDFAKTIIPVEERSSTPLFLKATAGMRRLNYEDASTLLAAVRRHFRETGFRFRDEWAQIITGQEEGVFGWFAANQLLGRFPPEATGVDVPHSNSIHSVGVLEMGGASTQITFEVPEDQTIPDQYAYQLPFCKRNHTLYAHSHLFYGMEAAFDKYMGVLSERSLIVLEPSSSTPSLSHSTRRRLLQLNNSPNPSSPPIIAASTANNNNNNVMMNEQQTHPSTINQQQDGLGPIHHSSTEELNTQHHQEHINNNNKDQHTVIIADASTHPLVSESTIAASAIPLPIESVPSTNNHNVGDVPPSTDLHSPCLFKGQRRTVLHNGKEVSVVGDGDFDKCASSVQSYILSKEKPCHWQQSCSFNGHYQPAVRGEWLAFENFFYTREMLGLPAHTSISAWLTEGRRVCSMELENVLETYKQVDHDKLQRMCFSIAYLTSLLTHGYGFTEKMAMDFNNYANNNHKLQIEWAVGAVIYELSHLLEEETRTRLRFVHRHTTVTESAVPWSSMLVLMFCVMIALGGARVWKHMARPTSSTAGGFRSPSFPSVDSKRSFD